MESTLLILLLFTFLPLIKSLCSEHETCFHCSSDISCSWSKNRCEEKINQQRETVEWYKNFDVCMSDSISKSKMEKLCGFPQFSSFPFNSELNFIEKNTYCRYKIFPEDPKKNLLIDFVRYAFNDSSKYSIELINEDLTYININLENNYYELKDNSPKEIIFHFLSRNDYKQKPFDLSIKNEITKEKDASGKEKKNELLTSIICGVGTILALGIISFVGYHCYQKSAMNNLKSQNKNNISIVEKNKILLKNVLTSIKFQSKNYSKYGDVCTICFDKLTEGQRAILLNCQHMFHEQCINIWIEQKILCPTCPNCKKNLLKIKEDSENLLMRTNLNTNDSNENNQNFVTIRVIRSTQ